MKGPSRLTLVDEEESQPLEFGRSVNLLKYHSVRAMSIEFPFHVKKETPLRASPDDKKPHF
jgi:hypothetical protein